MTKDEALDLALEALATEEYRLRQTGQSQVYPGIGFAITAIKQARSAPVQEPLSELEKDAANLLFALHDAWPYVHGNCTIESKRKAIHPQHSGNGLG